jgi:hypothetical protein
VGLALFGSVVLLGMVASDKHAVVGAGRLAEADPTFRPEEVAMSTGWGGVLMLIGALIALAGALLNHLSIGPTVAVGAGPAAPPAGRYGPPAGPHHSAPADPYHPPPPSN